MSILKLFPWERDEEPYFVNDEGFEWYVDKNLTNYANKKHINDNPPLKAVVFLVAKDQMPLSYVVMQNNEAVYESTKMEEVGAWIDIARVALAFKS